MATVDAFSTTTTMAGFLGVVAGIGAVCAYGYTQRDQLTRQGWGLFGSHSAERVHTRVTDGRGRRRGVEEEEQRGKGRRGRKKTKGKGREDEGEVRTGGEGDTGSKPQGKADGATVIPGGFDGSSAGAGLGSRTASPMRSVLATAGTVPMGSGGKTRKRGKKHQGRSKGRDDDNDRDLENKEAEDEGDEDKEASSEADKGSEIGGRLAAAYRTRSGGDSDASVSLPPSELGSTLASSSRSVAGKGHIHGSTTRLDVRSQPQIQVRPSLSFDTDSSWTHVDHRRIKMSRSMDGQAQGGMDTVDMTSSDMASTASDSPIAERANNVTDIRGEREDIPQRTLAEKLVPKPSKTGVDDMLEKPDVPTLARVMRVQPRADETPVAGFSWEDYGDVEDSLLVHDADQEDEGEWGIVKSRSRTRPQQQTTGATLSTSYDAAAADTMTKKQRQNARKRELAKAAKAETEAVRLQGLAKHKRELERLRIIEQSRQGGGKQPSGGMQASVDDRGKLVWE